MNILITSAGRRVSLAKAFQAEARKFDSGANILATDVQPELSAACQVADFCFKVPEATDPDYISVLIDICARNDVEMLIPNIDVELPVIAKNKGTLEETGAKIVISDPEFINICHDKRITVGFFEEMNIPTPQILDKESFHYPVYAKPYNGCGSQDNYIIRSDAELKGYHLNNENLLFFEYLEHSMYNEYTLDLYYDRHSVLKCVVPRKRIKVVEGEINKGLTERNFLIPFVQNRLSHVPGARGCLNLQLFFNKDNREVHGIELNPRFGGSYPLSYHAGANYPKWLIEEYLMDKSIDYFDSWQQSLLMLRYDAEVLVHNQNDL